MRLIDLNELLKFPMRRDTYDRDSGDKHFINGVESVLEYAENLPTVDIVRCKDCIHRDPEDKKCDCGCWHMPFTVEDNDFCSRGEHE